MTEGGKGVVLLVGIPPPSKPGAELFCFPLKKKGFTPKFFTLLVSLTIWTKSEIWLSKKSMVLAFPRDPEVSARTFPDSMSF